MAIGEVAYRVGYAIGAEARQTLINAGNTVIRTAQNYVRNAANTAVNQALSHVPAPLRGIARAGLNTGIAASGLGGILGGGLGGGVSYTIPEDFNALRTINKKLVQTEFVTEWNFRLEIEGQPYDFDFYVKDMSYNGFEIGMDEDTYGNATYSWPTTEQPCRISFTARENYDLRIATFLHSWMNKVIKNNGTVGLPFGKDGYTKKVTIYHIKDSGEEVPLYDNYAYPTQYGEVTRSHENCAFMEMPVTLVLFSTLYSK